MLNFINFSETTCIFLTIKKYLNFTLWSVKDHDIKSNNFLFLFVDSSNMYTVINSIDSLIVWLFLILGQPV